MRNKNFIDIDSELTLKFYGGRSAINLDDDFFEESFLDSVYSYNKRTYEFAIELTIGDKVIADMNGILYDEWEIINQGSTLVETADEEYQDYFDAICALVYEYDEYTDIWDEWGEGWINKRPCSGYINRLYIDKDYRGKGIASYLLNNFQDIIAYNIYIYPRYMTIFPKPMEEIEGHWKAIDDENMKKIMIDAVINNGFKEIGGNYYVRKYKEPPC